jgi:predicted PurR-regulated permease PerM
MLLAKRITVVLILLCCLPIMMLAIVLAMLGDFAERSANFIDRHAAQLQQWAQLPPHTKDHHD